MASGGIRRKDTTKGPPLRILSLDGGGVRGYSTLIILQELMHRTFVECEGRAPKRHEIPKPCEHFDLIAGTGTGGLIALMLGRLRLDIDTCKDVYVRLTKRVFETDKTIAGIPYRSTLFKASKLEEAIRECVREHTVDYDEGNDLGPIGSVQDLSSPRTPITPGSAMHGPTRTLSNASRYSQIGASPVVNTRSPFAAARYGNPNAPLYDSREQRTKTMVTAVFQGSKKGDPPVLLRSYDSRKEPAPEFNCTIWQAGRATAATALAFKPIQIGQSVFLDEGAGKYNPAPTVLDEAVCNEWPGREVGVFVSIGTGKRPPGTNNRQHEWWEDFVGGSMGQFAEARRRLSAKIEGCEDTHQYMLHEHLSQRHVNSENYYRLNVEVGVGEFGMNEWNRLAEISTNTRRYISKSDTQGMTLDAAAKLGRIYRAKMRWDRNLHNGVMDTERPLPGIPPPSDPMAVELPGDDAPTTHLRPQSAFVGHPNSNHFRQDFDEKIAISSPVTSDEFPTAVDPDMPPRSSGDLHSPYRRSYEDQRSSGEMTRPAPPLPPKTPLSYNHAPPPPPRQSPPRPPGGQPLPYPDMDGPPPVVNMARKPEFGAR